MQHDDDRCTRDAPGAARTVLFSDVVRSTEIIDEIGDSAWLDVVDRHTRAVVAAANNHRGSIANFQGDGFMIMFDGADDALACARQLQRDSAANRLLGLRIGIDQGYVYAFRASWWVGLTLHIASRLTELCERNQIAVSDRCVRSLSTPPDCFDIEPRLVSIRGLAEPCLVHVIDGRPLESSVAAHPSARPIANDAP